jgi:hypothetical protein
MTHTSTRPLADQDRTGDFSFSWGYNRAAYTPSSISLRGPGYALTLDDVMASDRPQLASVADVFTFKPQYNARISYQAAAHVRLSFALDHMKYVADAGQVVSATGRVETRASAAHAGVYARTPLPIGSPRSLLGNFEHTNGLNMIDLQVERTDELWRSRPTLNLPSFALSSSFGGGFGLVVPKSDVTLFQERRDNVFHIAGYGVSAVGGVRLDVGRYFFVEARIKAGIIHLPDVLTLGAGKASHAFAFVEPVAALGVTIPTR